MNRKRGKTLLSEEHGFTLVELLAALTLAGLIAGIAYTVLHSAFLRNDSIRRDTNLRNEANVIFQAMDTALKNTASLAPITEGGASFTAFTVLKRSADGNGFQPPLTVAFTANGDLTIGGRTLNHPSYTLTGSTASWPSEELKNKLLKVDLVIARRDGRSPELRISGTYPVENDYSLEEKPHAP